MLYYLEEKDSIEQNIIVELQSLNLQGEIKSERDEELYGFEIKDLSQFRDYFHVSECKEAISELDILLPSYESLFWKAFQLSDAAKNSIDEQLRKFTTKKLKNGVLDKWKHQMQHFSQEKKDEISNNLFSSVIKNNATVRNEYYNINKAANEKDSKGQNISSYEEQVGLSIYGQIPDINYSSLIYYFFLKHNILAEETFYLLFYLKYKIEDKFYQDNKNLIEQGIVILPYIGKLLKLTKIGYALYHNRYEENGNAPKEYVQFKDNCWKLILMEYNVLGEEKFNKQYELEIT